MATVWWVFSVMCPTKHNPLFHPIHFEVDVDARRARLEIPGLVRSVGEPIRNPVTNQPHRIEVKIPEGFEYREAEIASAWIKGTGTIKFDLTDAHSSLALVDHTPSGPA